MGIRRVPLRFRFFFFCLASGLRRWTSQGLWARIRRVPLHFGFFFCLAKAQRCSKTFSGQRGSVAEWSKALDEPGIGPPNPPGSPPLSVFFLLRHLKNSLGSTWQRGRVISAGRAKDRGFKAAGLPCTFGLFFYHHLSDGNCFGIRANLFALEVDDNFFCGVFPFTKLSGLHQANLLRVFSLSTGHISQRFFVN